MPEKTTVIAHPNEPNITITRWFEAPARLVFEATSKPELLRRWWGPHDSQMTVCEIDFRVGGSYRYVLRTKDGHEAGFRGEYREIVPYTKIVDTFIYDPYPDAPAVQNVTLDEQGGRTKLTIFSVYPSPAIRDAVIASGMERGLRETHDRLDAVLASLQR